MNPSTSRYVRGLYNAKYYGCEEGEMPAGGKKEKWSCRGEKSGQEKGHVCWGKFLKMCGEGGGGWRSKCTIYVFPSEVGNENISFFKQ